MKKNLFIALILVFINQKTFPQNFSTDYAFTVFYDTFDSLDRSKWRVMNMETRDSLYIWYDSPTTVYQANGDVILKASYSQNFVKDIDYITGELRSSADFTYGIFECNATFEYKSGAFPAFWIYNEQQCSIPYRPEIDIVEMKYDHSYPTLDYNIFTYPNCTSGPISLSPNAFKASYFNWSSQTDHTFKCLYWPSKIEFLTDNSYYHSYPNNGQTGFPNRRMHVILSQQLVNYNINVPSQANFHWVKVKEFFNIPTINCPALICTNGTAVLEIDSRAKDFSWSLTPSNLFSGNTSGVGKTANIVAAGPRGQGKITYTFKMPSVPIEETFTVERTFYVGDSGIIPVINGEDYLTCSNSIYTEANQKSVYWSVYGPLEIVGQNFGYRCTIKGTGNGYGWIYATNDCGSQTGEMFVEVDCGYFLALTPNPSTGETTVSIESTSKELVVDENEEWDLDVYSDFQSLKKKDSKLQGKYYKLQTSGWKEGIYIVRVKYKDLILQEKLLVK